MARQAGIDACTGEYITFIDADDRLSSCCSLYLYIAGIENYPDASLINYDFAMENMLSEDGTPLVTSGGGGDTGIVFAKLFKKSFLTEWDIRFTPELRVCEEDVHFLTVVYACINHTHAKYVIMNAIPYLYGYNPDSITRRDVPSFVVNICVDQCTRYKAYLSYLRNHGFEEFFEDGTVEESIYRIWAVYKACARCIEQHTPEKLVEVENAVFSTCVEIIRTYGFNIDKILRTFADIRETNVGTVGNIPLKYTATEIEFSEYLDIVIEAAKQDQEHTS